jgi:hypothetical protein
MTGASRAFRFAAPRRARGSELPPQLESHCGGAEPGVDQELREWVIGSGDAVDLADEQPRASILRAG